jgi:hypothetical protein
LRVICFSWTILGASDGEGRVVWEATRDVAA